MTCARDFAIVQPTVNVSGQRLDVAELVNAFRAANAFIVDMATVGQSLECDLWRLLNQRNLSGFIGTVAVRAIAASVDCLDANPHPDGQPDLVYVGSAAAAKHYANDCFSQPVSGTPVAKKSMFCPFRYGGLEVKATIGDSAARCAPLLRAATGRDKFDIGVPRVSCIRAINYWAHHRAAMNLLGLYYDYYPAAGGQPQILAAFVADLEEDDWGVLSTGVATKKKTSNTALTARGRAKLAQSCIAVIRDKHYTDALRRCGVRLPDRR